MRVRLAAEGGSVRIALLYTLFAGIATVVNIATQALAWRLLLPAAEEPWPLILSVVAGTGTGLIVKYVLDKRWIFAFRAKNRASGVRAFVLYTLFSVVTTVIFWGFEFGAEALFGTELARYVGAIAGLAIGYAAKYRLDKHITFGKWQRRQDEGTGGPA